MTSDQGQGQHWREALRILKLAVTQSSSLAAAPSSGPPPQADASGIHVAFAEAEVGAKKELPGTYGPSWLNPHPPPPRPESTAVVLCPPRSQFLLLALICFFSLVAVKYEIVSTSHACRVIHNGTHCKKMKRFGGMKYGNTYSFLSESVLCKTESARSEIHLPTYLRD